VGIAARSATRRAARRRALVAALLLALAVLVSGPAAGQEPVPLEDLQPPSPPLTSPWRAEPEPGAEPAVDERSHQLVDFDCRSTLGRRRVTLFGNGTIRLWDGLIDDQQMTLGELSPEELGGYLERLHAIDLSEVKAERIEADPAVRGVAAETLRLDRDARIRDAAVAAGDWVELCTLELHLGRMSEPPDSFRFSRLEALPLAVAEVVRVAQEIGGRTLPSTQLPVGYVPQLGDVLRRVDDLQFEVVGSTMDGQGVELMGVENPFTLYVRRDELPGLFTQLVSRRNAVR
jgi:hypothetical protein